MLKGILVSYQVTSTSFPCCATVDLISTAAAALFFCTFRLTGVNASCSGPTILKAHGVRLIGERSCVLVWVVGSILHHTDWHRAGGEAPVGGSLSETGSHSDRFEFNA